MKPINRKGDEENYEHNRLKCTEEGETVVKENKLYDERHRVNSGMAINVDDNTGKSEVR